MTDIPNLSIIVPNFNNGIYLRDCIESILNQTYKNFELIISDDCSDDDSCQIIEHYEKKYSFIKAIYHKVNLGISANRHSAINLSSGNYITTLDSDDIYYNNKKIENEMNLIKYFKEQHNKDICAFSNTVILDKNLKFLRVRGTKENIKEGYIINDIITRSCEIPLDFIMSRQSYDEVRGYNLSYHIYEDWDLKIRLASKYEFYFTGQNGTGYRQHDQGLSKAPFNVHCENLQTIFQNNLHLIDKKHNEEVKQKFEIFIQNSIKYNRRKKFIFIRKIKNLLKTLFGIS